MNRHPRLRKAAKWGGLGLAGVCVAAWGFTAVRSAESLLATGHFVELRGGAVIVSRLPSVPNAAAQPLRWPPGDLRVLLAAGAGGHWAPRAERMGTAWRVVVPLWTGSAAGLAAALGAWLLERRARRRVLAGHCPTCDYDRSTLPPAASCPECGAAGR